MDSQELQDAHTVARRASQDRREGLASPLGFGAFAYFFAARLSAALHSVCATTMVPSEIFANFAIKKCDGFNQKHVD